MSAWTGLSSSTELVRMRFAGQSFPPPLAAQPHLRMHSGFEGEAMTEIFPTTVYLLCLLTSLVCAWLLGRSYWHNGTRLLLWSAICFAFLAANNLVLVLDLVVWGDYVDLRLLRLLLALAAIISLIWGFVWEVGEE